MYVDMCIHIFVSVMEKISSGRMSPVRGRTMKEYDTVSTVGKKICWLYVALSETLGPNSANVISSKMT